MERTRKWASLFAVVCAATMLGLCPPQAEAFNQPPYNLGLTNALDGAIPGPGMYLMAYSQFYFANEIDVNDDVPTDVFLGPEIGNINVKSILEDTEINADRIRDLLDQGKIVIAAGFQGVDVDFNGVLDLCERSVIFVQEVWAELKKVHWPSRKEVTTATIVVLAVVMIVAVFLGLVDFGVSRLVQLVLGS